MFFFNDTATTEIYTLSLHDALPIYSATSSRASTTSPSSSSSSGMGRTSTPRFWEYARSGQTPVRTYMPWRLTDKRSEEHTSELQSRQYLVCRLLLEKKKEHPNARMT